MERSTSDVPGGQEHTDRADAVAPGGRPALSANVYVDGFNLWYGCLQATGYQWLDIGAFCRRLLPGNSINRIRYFTSRVAARPDAPHGPEQQNAYLRALSTVPALSVHEGGFQSLKARLPLAGTDPPVIVDVIKTQEKGSDVNLAAYMLLDAFRRESDIAVVISNDSDLTEPIRMLIKELGVPVGLVNPHPVKKRSRVLLELEPLFFKQVRPRVLRTCQFPPVLRDDTGEIHRPDGW